MQILIYKLVLIRGNLVKVPFTDDELMMQMTCHFNKLYKMKGSSTKINRLGTSCSQVVQMSFCLW